jgi:hypothetical protein
MTVKQKKIPVQLHWHKQGVDSTKKIKQKLENPQFSCGRTGAKQSSNSQKSTSKQRAKDGTAG